MATKKMRKRGLEVTITTKRVRRFRPQPLPRYEIEKSKQNGEFFWRYLADNGKEVGKQSETHKRRRTVMRSIEIMRGSGKSVIVDKT